MDVTSLPFQSAVYTPGLTFVLVIGLTTGGVVVPGVSLGLVGSDAAVVDEPPPHAVRSAAKVTLKKTSYQAPSDEGIAFRLMVGLEVDMITCFALECEYFIVGT